VTAHSTLPKIASGLAVVLVAALVAAAAGVAVSTHAQAGPPPTVTMEQCANGDNNEYSDCVGAGGGTGWVTGNVGTSKSSYLVDDFIPYRAVFDRLTVGADYCFGMNWDVAKDILPTIDYLGSFDATLASADPTEGTAHTLGGSKSTVAIPADPSLTGTLDGVSFSGSQDAAVLTMWGGTLDASALTYAITSSIDLANETQSLEYCFEATSTEAVLAWSGHIGLPSDWGATERPTGSPYHMAAGTIDDAFSGDRSSDSDLSCNLEGVVTHNNIGRQDLSLGIDPAVPPTTTTTSSTTTTSVPPTTTTSTSSTTTTSTSSTTTTTVPPTTTTSTSYDDGSADYHDVDFFDYYDDGSADYHDVDFFDYYDDGSAVYDDDFFDDDDGSCDHDEFVHDDIEFHDHDEFVHDDDGSCDDDIEFHDHCPRDDHQYIVGRFADISRFDDGCQHASGHRTNPRCEGRRRRRRHVPARWDCRPVRCDRHRSDPQEPLVGPVTGGSAYAGLLDLDCESGLGSSSRDQRHGRCAHQGEQNHRDRLEVHECRGRCHSGVRGIREGDFDRFAGSEITDDPCAILQGPSTSGDPRNDAVTRRFAEFNSVTREGLGSEVGDRDGPGSTVSLQAVQPVPNRQTPRAALSLQW
jgi:hypothetical protein